MTWERLLAEHQFPRPRPPACITGLTPLAPAVHLIPQPAPRRRCALCGRRGVVATDGERMACVRCMVCLTGQPVVNRSKRFCAWTWPGSWPLTAAVLLASLVLGGWLLWPAPPPQAAQARTTGHERGWEALPALPVGAQREETRR